MTEAIIRTKLINIINKINIIDDIKQFLIKHIDEIDHEELIEVLIKYSDRINQIKIKKDSESKKYKISVDLFSNKIEDYITQNNADKLLENI